MKLNKKKKIIFLSENISVDYLKPVSSSRKIPDWYKGIEQVKDFDFTIKKCVPVLDAFTTGYIFQTSADVIYDEELNRFIDNGTSQVLSAHKNSQTDGFDLGLNLIPNPYKWINNFFVKTPKGYSMIFTHPFNRFDLPFQTLTGVVDTDEFPLSVQFPFFMKKGFSGVIPAGTPIAQGILIKREDWYTDKKEQKESYSYSEFWKWFEAPLGKYKKYFWKKKKYL